MSTTQPVKIDPILSWSGINLAEAKGILYVYESIRSSTYTLIVYQVLSLCVIETIHIANVQVSEFEELHTFVTFSTIEEHLSCSQVRNSIENVLIRNR